jgi:hypothetical protein
MSYFQTCRLCHGTIGPSDPMVRYSTRSCAHADCWLARRRLDELPWHQIEQLPFRLLQNLGLLDEARRLIEAKNTPKSARQKRIDKIFGLVVSVGILCASSLASHAENPRTPNDAFLESLEADKQLALGFYDNGVCEAYVRQNRPDLIPFPGAEKPFCTAMKAFAHERSMASPKGPNWVVPPHND